MQLSALGRRITQSRTMRTILKILKRKIKDKSIKKKIESIRVLLIMFQTTLLNTVSKKC